MPEGNLSGRSAEEKAANQIIVFNYGDYIDRDILGQFEEETGIKAVPHTVLHNNVILILFIP